MELVRLRLTTFSGGAEKLTIWQFTPLRLPRSYTQARETGNDGEGRVRRRPLNIRTAVQLKIPAGTLLSDANFANFLRLLMAHKIEWQKNVNGKPQWIEYDLDVDGALPDPDHPEDIDRLRTYTLKLVQAAATWYTDFEDMIANFENA